MRNQAKYLLIYLCVLSILIGSVVNLAQAQNSNNSATEITTQSTGTSLTQAQIEQLLAPIALYPDTLLSHILVASTYPLEVIQAARWRKLNEDLNEQQALDSAEQKDWDPSVQALAPFNDLLQTLSDDLEWLQSLGNAFLFDEEKILASVQVLRQKAYAQGNLNNNQYMDVEKDANEIVIHTIEKEVVYIPYYDTRTIYGNWGWNNHPPHYWQRPSHYVLSAGFYWSSRFFIRPSFYFSGFQWHRRHLVADYAYRTHRDNRNWAHSHTRKKTVRVSEYPRWTHNQQHRRGVHYKSNGKDIIRSSDNPNRYISVNNSSQAKKTYQIDKQRVLNTHSYPSVRTSNNKDIKRQLNTYQQPLNIHKGQSINSSRLNRDSKHKTIHPKATRQVNSGQWKKQVTTNPPHNSPQQVRTKPRYDNFSAHSKSSNQRNKSNAHSKKRYSTVNKSRPLRSKGDSSNKERR